MKINDYGSTFVRGAVGKDPQLREQDRREDPEAPEARAPRGDRVGISSAGMALAARASEIEARIAGGVYNDPAMAEEVARRVLASGDLDLEA